MYFFAGSVSSLPPITEHRGEPKRVDGTLTHYHRGGNAISELSTFFFDGLVSSLPPITEHRGEPQRVDGTLAC